MYDIEIFFVGGTVNKITEIPEEICKNLVNWLDDKNRTETFKLTFSKYKKSAYYRKEVILYINLIEY